MLYFLVPVSMRRLLRYQQTTERKYNKRINRIMSIGSLLIYAMSDIKVGIKIISLINKVNFLHLY